MRPPRFQCENVPLPKTLRKLTFTNFYALAPPQGPSRNEGGALERSRGTPPITRPFFCLSPEGPPWTAKSSPGARKHYKKTVFLTFLKSLRTIFGSPRGPQKKRVRRPEGPRGPLPKTRTDFFEAPRAPLDAQRELWSRFSNFSTLSIEPGWQENGKRLD